MSWPNIADKNFEKIQQEFVSGTISKNDVLNYLNEIGLYAVSSDKDKDKKSFIGTAIEPNTKKT
ncbi:hypothetical protein JYU00_02025 [bacterium AH-315-N22]|nr:hypothetical protein [bacterium AH-315-N22]